MATTNTLHVNGRADIYFGTAGSAPTNLLGWTVDGVELSETHYGDDVLTDNKGPHIPEDVQNFGAEARITIDLIKYDADKLALLLPRLAGGTLGVSPNNAGVVGTSEFGQLMMQCSKMFSVGVKKTTTQTCENDGEGGWWFGYAYLVDERGWKVGTKVTRHRLVFRCLPYESGSTTAYFTAGF